MKSHMRALPVLLLTFALVAACGQKTEPAAASAAQPKTSIVFKAGLVGNDFQPVKPPQNTVDIATAADGAVTGDVIRSTMVNAVATGDTDTAIVRLPPDDMAGISGKTATIIVTARSAERDGSPKMRVAYSRAGVGSSGWQEFTLTPAFSDYSFKYAVPSEPSANAPRDFVAVWGDPDGKGRGSEVSQVRVTY